MSRNALPQNVETAFVRYRELFELAPNGYLTTDVDGRVSEVNLTAEALFGRPRGELAGTSLLAFVPEAERGHFRARLEALRSGRAERIQDWQITFETDAASFDAEVTVGAVADAAGGAVLSLVWLVRDVTERKRAEERLRDRERQLKQTRNELRDALARSRAILDSAVDGIVTISEAGVVESVNPSAEKMFGYSADELVGENVGLLMSTPDREEHDGYLRRYLESGEKRIIGIGREVVGRHKDGTEFPLDLAVAEFFHGERRAFVGILRDVTGRKEIEEALRRERDFAESLVETAPAIVLVLDLEGRIVRFNRYLEEISGRRLEEARGKDWFTLFLPPGDRPRVRTIFTDVLSGEATRGENEILTKDGDERQIEWHNTLLRDAEGEITGVLAIGQDVTERRRLEEQFRQAQKMEAVGRLAGGVAHDFNTLLGSITGYSEMLLEGLAPGDPLRRAAEQIHRGAGRGAALTRQLLAFSRHQVLQPRVLDLGAVIADMDDMVRRLIGADVELVHGGDAELGRVRVDAGQFEQAIMNLVVNARDAMPRGGRLTISTRNVEIGEHEATRKDVPAAGPYVVVEVADTGCGMDDETRQRLFEPFFTTKERGKGTGLGLSTVYGIVKQSKGGITFKTEAGCGTTFRIFLPRVDDEPAVEAEREPVPAPPAAGGETVLLVEDDNMFRELLGQILETSGYQVLATGDPVEALSLAQGSPIHLVVSDMVMPGITGTELAERLLDGNPEMKVLLMSGYTGEDLNQRGASGGVAPFLQKPFSTKDFLRAVREVLASG